MNSSDKNLLLEFLNENRLMFLATSDGKGNLWSATVYFAVDEDLSLYLLSPPSTRHCQDIEDNENVACAITDTTQLPNDKKIGMQITGKAKKVDDKKTKEIVELWNKKFKGYEIDYELLMKEWESKFYKITPTHIKWFNEELYGNEGFAEWEL